MIPNEFLNSGWITNEVVSDLATLHDTRYIFDLSDFAHLFPEAWQIAILVVIDYVVDFGFKSRGLILEPVNSELEFILAFQLPGCLICRI